MKDRRSDNELQEVLKRLPSVDRLLHHREVKKLLDGCPRKIVVNSIREVLEARRKKLTNGYGHLEPPSIEEIVEEVTAAVKNRLEWTLRPVINATGVIIHTNLGRSLLPTEAIDRVCEIASRYNNLEYDLAGGKRGSRYVHAESLIAEITGAEGALVVNNNAAAVFLVLNTLAQGREVIVSRGELVEIGGSFRMPDVMAKSGAVLKEVGCTNRTHLRDYEGAISENTAMILKVHKSNYRIVGFTKEVSTAEIAELAHRKGLLAVEDMGSGCFIDLSRFGLRDEPVVQTELAEGMDLVTFSGDKLLGGPQAGIIVGKKELVEKCKKNPMTRAFRVDKLTLAALEATLRLYLDEATAIKNIPTLRMIATPLHELEERARKLAGLLTEAISSAEDGASGERYFIGVEPTVSRVGGGSLPEQDLPSWAVSVRCSSASRIEKLLRSNKPPIIVRVENDALLMDVRTLLPEDDGYIVTAFKKILGEHSR
ncbi:L-seryl-tRNA(Sec) selenium transferase [Thermodesulforhabdus norvegica]|uniref:L-seryl-tRNA(Sec) selenium transferase n=1 Tax=Thermodesulforhabdus norvegica TaxID=39841 RepID=A0A1I4RIS6_9BACT|nr:L-seryl-tRNA(Sec) selenium transferase [Thermodesulforhabdus norvegica]SFM51840.1 L-seryl-tRNA(Sec) selenium transferase [Thermodesulforhabdus norvegica]